MSTTTFSVVGAPAVRAALAGAEQDVVDRVREAYLLHAAGGTVNPDSYFLRFPEKPDSRIIALPAFLGGESETAGIKWISSFPSNHDKGLPRASAVLVLNDYDTGYPKALLESATISAARTAASAALAAGALQRTPPRSWGVIGAGVIAREICRYLAAITPVPPVVHCHDLNPGAAERFADELPGGQPADLATACDADLVVFATTALSPHLPADYRFRPSQLVLHVSLRDLAPETLLHAVNIVDDVDHCLKQNTSPHLAEQLCGDRSFVAGTIADVLRGNVTVPDDRPVIFSPFGMGVLDLAVGRFVLDRTVEAGTTTEISDFFAPNGV
ncbi:2,3-diaminopropionate biosynthesis protein SbnB [Streptomyces sp. NBC_00882]|uniref:2,3-diaminopropionate biosynthesis protein SbnB n=1 Tax=Streptomyces TaxID=1883 RepID=UPI0038691BF2|nr:2,3-diaminopropionate biosynthesis protein SbnB [Streptomyces sp. NBC_00882]WSZ60852.1 2,3-diaminopropionate biosynthesis protein SbnB [Streptomyces canus]